MSEANAARRRALERVLKESALDLFQQTGSAAYMLPIPGTTPQLYVAVGEREQVEQLAKMKE